MKQGIIIGTSPGREKWLHDFMESITVPCVVLNVEGYELGKIRWAYENTDFDRFIFLQDSLVIKNNQLLESVFDVTGSACLMCDPDHFGSYLGLYERSVLDKVGIPVAHTKVDAIKYEWEWTKKYVEACDNLDHPINLNHQIVYTVYKHGRENMLYINDLYEKWKGDWGQINHS
jgi:hypothetical protein